MENHRTEMPIVKTPEKGSIDVRAIRLQTQGAIGATQESFANAIGVPVKTLRNWEQGRREPSGPARVLLSLVKQILGSYSMWSIISGDNWGGHQRPLERLVRNAVLLAPRPIMIEHE